MRVEFCGIKIELLYITINFRYIHSLNKGRIMVFICRTILTTTDLFLENLSMLFFSNLCKSFIMKVLSHLFSIMNDTDVRILRKISDPNNNNDNIERSTT